MKKPILIVVVLLILVTSIADARKGPTIQDRLAKLEKQIQQPSDDRNNLADIVVANQTLQQQIAELKGVIEEQNHQIQSLKEKQKLLYIDLDSRLAELELAPNANNISSQSNASPEPELKPNQALTVEVDENYGNNSVETENIVVGTEISSFQQDYDVAFAHLRAGRFLESARSFENFIQKFPNSDLTDNAYYWLGESYYVKRQYPQALSAFQTLTQKFPNSKKVSDALLKIGYSYYEMDDLVKAEENLQRVINNYPNSSIARLAKNRLRQLQRDH